MPAPRDTTEGIDRPVVLVGFMAAGKSRIGRILAERLSLPFVDTDAKIEKACGASIAEIFRKRGEAEFRTLEREVISRLLDRGPQVVATGGGAFVDGGTREELGRKAWTVWLDIPFDLALARLARSTKRPLAACKSEAELRSLWDERRPCYARAHIRIGIQDADPGQIADRIIVALRAQTR